MVLLFQVKSFLLAGIIFLSSTVLSHIIQKIQNGKQSELSWINI